MHSDREVLPGGEPMTRAVPFFPPDLFEEERGKTLQIVKEVGLSPDQKFILGEAVARLEQKISADAGARHAIACSSGTGALALVVDAMGIRRHDEVIVP